MKKWAGYVTLFARLALSAGFLSAVADRFGYWGQPGAPGVAWGEWRAFSQYTGRLTAWLVTDAGLVEGLAVLATGLEVLLGLLLLVGYRTRLAALGSGLLLLSFGLAMTVSTGSPKVPFDYSVFAASAAAFALATADRYRFSLDASTGRR